jgi:hypothetical protein
MRTTRKPASSYDTAVSGSNALQPRPRAKLSLIEGGRSRVGTTSKPVASTTPALELQQARQARKPTPRPRQRAQAPSKPSPRPRRAQVAVASAPKSPQPRELVGDTQQVEVIGPEASRWLTVLVTLSVGILLML